jgi:hypothetical protein
MSQLQHHDTALPAQVNLPFQHENRQRIELAQESPGAEAPG